MTIKQIALLSGKAGIHHTAIPIENERVDEKDRFCIFELYLNDTEPTHVELVAKTKKDSNSFLISLRV